MEKFEPTNLKVGLTTNEANKRLLIVGPNEIEQEKKRSLFSLIFDQFKSPLVIILIFACFVSLALGEKVEAIAIGAILIINALIGFFQEYRAENSIAALREMTAPRTRVLRNGQQNVILAHDIVPGDILLLEAGDIVAADAELIEASRFQVNEALLTGESLPIDKASTKPIFMGTSVVAGSATAIVASTGMKTELGKIAHLLKTAQTEITPLQKQLTQIGTTLLYLCLGVILLVAILGFIRGMEWLELLIFSVSLAVAAVPEGMPAIVTVALALGIQRMAAQNALIKKLPSVETLGSVSVICTDKTGTLTTGNMRVREVNGASPQEILIAAASCCDAELSSNESEEGTGDPTEIAILLAAREKNIHKKEIEQSNSRLSIEPFDADRRRMSIFRQDQVNYVKGAVENILPLCLHDQKINQEILNQTAEMSGRGLRVLAIAKGSTPKEENLEFLGLLGMADPPRKEAIGAIKEARAAGIMPIMITGDHPQTARAIAKEIGLVKEGEDVETRVYARATPEEKLKLVRYWKEKKAIVAMTGDGVNDAPALREAHIGIAMGKTGTEVTRQAADLILADDNFATIVSVVREGRGIFQNIRKSIVYLLTGNFAEVALVLGAAFMGLPLPLLAAHLLWINLVTDALPALTLIADPISKNTMKKPPRSSDEKLLGKKEWMRIILVGILEAGIALGFYHYLLQSHDKAFARSIVFTTIVLSQVLRVFVARSTTQVIWQVGFFNNKWLLAVAFLTVAMQISIHYLPLTQKIFGLHSIAPEEFLVMIPLAIIPTFFIEAQKIIKIFFFQNSQPSETDL